MDPQIRELGWSVVRGLLPYPDPFRRRRIRSLSRNLVRCDPWPGNEATPLQLTELALLRALWLQRITRRAARFRQLEAAGVLARSAIENCILGLYCLYCENPMDRLRGSNAGAIEDLFQYLVDDDALKSEFIKLAQETIGGSGRLPNVFRMAEKVANSTSSDLTRDMYKRLYVPLSTLMTHANGLTLLRHVKSDNSLSQRPTFPWLRRSAVRTVDTCVGVLALAVSNRSGLSAERFAEYANDHLKRSLAPLVVMAGRHMRYSIRWLAVLKGLRDLNAGRKYALSTQFEVDPWEVRESKIRHYVTSTMSVFDPGENAELYDKMLDILVTIIVGAKPEESNSNS